MTLDELIAALESAPEGSRDLDYPIARFFGWEEREVSEHWEIAWHDPEGIQRLNGPPRFSTSLDAALPGENIECMSWLDGKCNVLQVNHDRQDQWTGVAATEPLARRAAALRGMK